MTSASLLRVVAISLAILLEPRSSYGQFIEVPTHQSISLGGSIQQKCRHGSTAGYSWKINSTSVIPGTPKAEILDMGTLLHYGPVEVKDDYLLFTCTVHLNDGRSIASPAGSLRVCILPRASAPAKNRVFNEGDNVWLNFSVSCHSHPITRTWLHNGVAINVHSSFPNAVIHGSALKINHITREQAGNYTLVVRNVVGSASASLLVAVVYNEFLVVPLHVSTQIGHKASFQCRHRFGRGYSWRINQSYVDSTKPRVSVKWKGSTSVLEYGPVELSDDYSLVYCLAFLSTGRIYTSHPGRLRILAKPILSGAENVQIRVSFKLQLNYTVLSYPQALSYEWLFNGQPLSLAGPLKTPGGGVLIIEEVSRADEGLYILRVTNEIGTGEWSTRVSVLYPPIISGGPFFVFAPVGRPFTIPCGKQIEANPQPDYRWLYKGAAIPMSFNTTTLKDGGLLFYEAEFSQNGSYTCIAWNNLGEANITLTFFINNPPSAPLNVTVLAHGSSWVALSWNEVVETGDFPLVGYRIIVRPISHNGLTRVPEQIKAVSKVTSTNVTGLIPSVNYSVYVETLTNVSTITSIPSEQEHFTSDKSVPSIAAVSGVIHGPAEMIVSWQVAYTGGYPISLFAVEFRKYPTNDPWTVIPSVTNITSNTTNYSVSVGKLEGEQWYVFRVAAINSLGRGAYRVSQPTLSDLEGTPHRPLQPVVTGLSDHCAVLGVSVPRTTSTNTIHTLSVTIFLNGTAVIDHRVAVDNSSLLDDGAKVAIVYHVTLDNVSYDPVMQFTVSAVNLYGTSQDSPVSQQAFHFVNNETKNFLPGNYVVMVLMLIIILMTGVLSVITCLLNYKENPTKDEATKVEPNKPASQAQGTIKIEQSQISRREQLRMSLVLDDELWAVLDQSNTPKRHSLPPSLGVLRVNELL